MTYNFCQKCCTRFEACAECHKEELAEKDKELEGLRQLCKDLDAKLTEAEATIVHQYNMIDLLKNVGD